jgi:hypothetical protein
MITEFQIGQTYSTRAMYECIYSFVILARTAKTVTVKVSGKAVRRRVHVNPYYPGVEQFKPFGTHSMCVVIHASDPDLSGERPALHGGA